MLLFMLMLLMLFSPIPASKILLPCATHCSYDTKSLLVIMENHVVRAALTKSPDTVIAMHKDPPPALIGLDWN